MNVGSFLEKRRPSWKTLEEQIESLSGFRGRRDAKTVVEFAALYRAACADLALAQEYRLPQETVRYLHQLVARAHNVLYRSSRFQWRKWGKILFSDVPRRLYRDRYLWIALTLFWGSFLGSTYLGFLREDFAVEIAGEQTLEGMEEMYSEPIGGRQGAMNAAMAGFYIQNNTGIGLRCFAMGIFVGVGSIYEMVFNAIFLGAIFGHMITSPHAPNFFEFVTAHGPFELTAIAAAAAAGFRLGFSIIDTNGLSRYDSLRIQARKSLEVALVAAILFILAAFIEGFISPSAAPYAVKAAVALASTAALIAYVVVLGRRGAEADAT